MAFEAATQVTKIVIARSEATKQSSLSSSEELDCFAPLAMTEVRNDNDKLRE
jgi:hypothetical protein